MCNFIIWNLVILQTFNPLLHLVKLRHVNLCRTTSFHQLWSHFVPLHTQRTCHQTNSFPLPSVRLVKSCPPKNRPFPIPEHPASIFDVVLQGRDLLGQVIDFASWDLPIVTLQPVTACIIPQVVHKAQSFPPHNLSHRSPTFHPASTFHSIVLGDCFSPDTRCIHSLLPKTHQVPKLLFKISITGTPLRKLLSCQRRSPNVSGPPLLPCLPRPVVPHQKNDVLTLQAQEPRLVPNNQATLRPGFSCTNRSSQVTYLSPLTQVVHPTAAPAQRPRTLLVITDIQKLVLFTSNPCLPLGIKLPQGQQPENLPRLRRQVFSSEHLCKTACHITYFCCQQLHQTISAKRCLSSDVFAPPILASLPPCLGDTQSSFC